MVVNRSALIAGYLKAQAPATASERRRLPFRNGTECPVIQVPTKDLLFNPRLGRLVLVRLKDPGRLENPEEAEAQAAIQKELLSHRESKELAGHIKDEGQLEPGIVTSDGVLLNGNRRLSVLRQLWEQTKDDKFAYMKVVVLPADARPDEMYLLEVTLQMTPETRARYGPITTLVQLREGLRVHRLDKVQLAHAMYKSADELEEQINILQLVDEYLKFIKRPHDYLHLEDDLADAGKGKGQHFLELNLLRKKHASKPFWAALKLHVFQLIRSGATYEDIRALKSWNDQSDIEYLAKQLGAPASPKKKAPAKGDLDSLADALDGVKAAAAKKGVATVDLPAPQEPAKPDPGGKVDPADPEVQKTVEAVKAVNELVSARKAQKRPVELLRKSLRSLEAAQAMQPAGAADAAEAKTLLRDIARLAARMAKGLKGVRAKRVPSGKKARAKARGR
ncbi:MAG: hypothetical protein IT460_08260 [Planctomycetes bacterium]|nr:hypothetical protein [Planctomycetota bacterium]